MARFDVTDAFYIEIFEEKQRNRTTAWLKSQSKRPCGYIHEQKGLALIAVGSKYKSISFKFLSSLEAFTPSFKKKVFSVTFRHPKGLVKVEHRLLPVSWVIAGTGAKVDLRKQTCLGVYYLK